MLEPRPLLYAALLISFLPVGCSKTSKGPKEDELMLTPIEDLDFSHGSEEDDGEWPARLYGPGYNFEGDWPHGDYVLNVNKYIRDGSPWYNMPWNANYEGKACCS